MCGIVGVAYWNGQVASPPLLQRMVASIVHRGPDGEGFYLDGPVGLAHRRLAILDLSPSGHQPMANEDGSVILNYNGEIYNFRELRVELEAKGHLFHSQTDSEVIVHAYEEWGADCLTRFNGMFAFAIWDRRAQILFLARDRYGIKPLYWFSQNGTFIFASEIKAILPHPDVSRRVCPEALSEYFAFQNVLTDLTLFDGIRLLQPGHFIRLDLKHRVPNPTPVRYWDFEFTLEEGDIDLAERADEVRQSFVLGVTRQLISDVPIGAYLSGGIDSGSIAAIASQNLGRLTTFTGGFDLSSASGLEMAFDERHSAEVLSNYFKTEHYESVLHAGDMEWVLPKLIYHLEDLRVGQCYPNYYVARLASKFVKVALSGAGGDELFAGYPWRYYRGMHATSREEYLSSYYHFWQRLVPDGERDNLFAPEIRRSIGDHAPFDVFRGVFDGWKGGFTNRDQLINASLYFELKTFLHGLLIVEDKISMAHSLEARVPFLDNDVVDLALRTSPRLKLNNLEDSTQRIDENLAGKRQIYEMRTADGKRVLREAMRTLVPDDALDRAKQGFSAPDASWFRGESIDYINRLLRDPKARIYEFLSPKYVSHVLDEHCAGQVNRRLLIWSLLSFEWWNRTFMD